MTCARFSVTGKVQGVYFRAATRDRARELGIAGTARNLPDGSVEVVARGSTEALAELAAWLHHGPPAARVMGVRQELLPDPAPVDSGAAGFTIG